MLHENATGKFLYQIFLNFIFEWYGLISHINGNGTTSLVVVTAMLDGAKLSKVLQPYLTAMNKLLDPQCKDPLTSKPLFQQGWNQNV